MILKRLKSIPLRPLGTLIGTAARGPEGCTLRSIMKTKRCCKCKEEFPVSAFGRNRSTKDGLHPECLECSRAAHREYKKKRSERDPGWLTREGKLYKARYPERMRANWAVGEAVKRGRLCKPSMCEVCEKEPAAHGHHDSYDKDRRLTVCWMCTRCHIWTHQKRRELK